MSIEIGTKITVARIPGSPYSTVVRYEQPKNTAIVDKTGTKTPPNTPRSVPLTPKNSPVATPRATAKPWPMPKFEKIDLEKES